MRPTPPPAIAVLVVVAAQYSDESLTQLYHPPSSPSSSASTCDSNTCTRPSSGEERLEANAATILIILLCALICAVALNIAIRCSLRHSRRQLETQAQQQQHVRKPDMQDVEVQLPPSPTLIFSVGMKLAGEETECAICLSEFVEGEGIRVLDKCRHGFHVHCIQKWLSSHSSCPTCRASCLPSLSVSDEESGTTSNRSSAPGGGVPDSF